MAGYSANSGETDDRFLENVWNHRWLLLASSLAGASWGFAGIFFMTRVLHIIGSEESRSEGFIWMFANMSILGMTFGVPWSALAYQAHRNNQATKPFLAKILQFISLNLSVVGRGIVVGICFLLVISFFSAIVQPGTTIISASEVFVSLGFYLMLGFIFGSILALFSMIPAGIIMAPLTQALWDVIARENTKRKGMQS
jgi:hypothetical protein